MPGGRRGRGTASPPRPGPGPSAVGSGGRAAASRRWLRWGVGSGSCGGGGRRGAVRPGTWRPRLGEKRAGVLSQEVPHGREPRTELRSVKTLSEIQPVSVAGGGRRWHSERLPSALPCESLRLEGPPRVLVWV